MVRIAHNCTNNVQCVSGLFNRMVFTFCPKIPKCAVLYVTYVGLNSPIITGGFDQTSTTNSIGNTNIES